MAPPKPNKPSGPTWDEYRLLNIETISWLTSEVRKLHDEILVLKVKFFFVSAICGLVGGIIATVIGGLILHHLK